MPLPFARLKALRRAAIAVAPRRTPEHRPERYAYHYEHILGTSLELQVVAASVDAAARAETAVLHEVDRLATILSGYDASSEFSLWQEGRSESISVSAELADVLAAAEHWRTATNDAFNPAASSVIELIKDVAVPATDAAERAGSRSQVVQERIDAMSRPLWTVDPARGVACRLTVLPVSLDAIAKGYIIDRALAQASAIGGVTQVLVNIGGDLAHRGARPIMVHVADPNAPAENAPPIAVVRLAGEALATSGGYRRGFMMDGQCVSHIIDPRTGRPAARVVSASVIASDCMTADALSTAFSVMTPGESVALADSLAGVGCMMVERDGRVTSNSEWQRHTANSHSRPSND